MVVYRSLSHMSVVSAAEEKCSLCYYIPHHAVLKSQSITKLCVVFNESAKLECGRSLNDVLMVGDKLQHELFDILVSFHLHRIAFTADIAKMYRQILVQKHYCDLPRIVWRNGPQENIQTYRIITVT